MSNIGLPEIMVIFVMLFLLGFALILLTGGLRYKQARLAQRALIDKIPPDQLVALLDKPDRGKLVYALAEGGASPERSILTSIQRGIVIFVTGSGVFVTAMAAGAKPFVFIGIIVIFLGGGLLLAAFVTYRLSKRWHLLDENHNASIRRSD